jgi:hypothetical protein
MSILPRLPRRTAHRPSMRRSPRPDAVVVIDSRNSRDRKRIASARIPISITSAEVWAYVRARRMRHYVDHVSRSLEPDARASAGRPALRRHR